ncbi:hypothetical protein O988_07336 [Pseudogymnoascus sp. VKM F-3808]|nr:hypothetical protein O988_07336 [Pseudogymnoascus sp. VKM F-3808]
MTRSKNLRRYRACQRCRRRKLRCVDYNTGSGDHQPCFECFRAGETCLAADSRRGGNYSHLRASKARQPTPASSNGSPSPAANYHIDQGTLTAGISDTGQTLHSNHSHASMYAELNNPGDALQILSRIATSEINSSQNRVNVGAAILPSSSSIGGNREIGKETTQHHLSTTCAESSEAEYLVNHVLGVATASQLLEHYARNYHPFAPLASKKVLDPFNISTTAIEEPLLLVAILTISSKDDNQFLNVYQQCWCYLKRQMLDLVLAVPSTLQVGRDGVGSSGLHHRNLSTSEDNMAWSLIGQAVRHAYLLRLDLVSFREKVPGESRELEDRKRLAWIFVYIADRQISVRMGQSFWSRGPSLSTKFTADDFPSLQLTEDSEHCYASVLQATIELTQLLHNVKDVLYSSKARTAQMMLVGDYNLYLDDFRRSLSIWQETWCSLNASPKLKSTLTIVYEYVRLYVNAFSFQSLITRACREDSTANTDRSFNLFPRGIMGSTDGAYIFEATHAAKTIITIMTQTDPTVHVRYMPTRFYIYTIYSAVFLHKAVAFGAFSTKEEEADIRNLVYTYILILQEAATNDSHNGYRYSSLLKALWFPGETSSLALYGGKSREASSEPHRMDYNKGPSAPSEPMNSQTTFHDDYNNGNHSTFRKEMALPILDDGILDPFFPWLADMSTPQMDTGGTDASIGVNAWMNSFFSGLANY